MTSHGYESVHFTDCLLGTDVAWLRYGWPDPWPDVSFKRHSDHRSDGTWYATRHHQPRHCDRGIGNRRLAHVGGEQARRASDHWNGWSPQADGRWAIDLSDERSNDGGAGVAAANGFATRD